jgi:glucan phosphorylase
MGDYKSSNDEQAGDASTGTLVKEQVARQTQQVAQQATNQATSQLNTQKGRAVQSLSQVSDALEQTSQRLRTQQQGPAAELVAQASQRLDRLAGYLDQRDVTQLIAELEDTARAQPALFLGGAFVLGLLAARFLKSSSPPDNRSAPYAEQTRAGETPWPSS